jgi:hypothetical protein
MCRRQPPTAQSETFVPLWAWWWHAALHHWNPPWRVYDAVVAVVAALVGLLG